MTRYVIDAPTLVRLVVEGIDVAPSHQLVAPSLIRSHAMDLLLAAVVSGAITDEVALDRHERLTGIKIRLLNDRVSRRVAWKLAREQGWSTTADAEYIAVCQLQADALVTVDDELRAKAEGLVPLASVDALVGRRAPATSAASPRRRR